MKKEDIEKVLKEALDSVSGLEGEFKVVAFKCVLDNLLSSQKQVANPGGQQAPTPKSPAGNVSAGAIRIPSGLSEDTLSEIFSVVGDEIELKVKVEAETVAEQQRKLAHVLLLGYKVLLGVTEVKGSAMIKVAKEWDISTTSFPRNVKASEHIQTKNGGTGNDPKYLLRPGSLDKVSEELKSLV